MSRVGKKPISIPSGVKVVIDNKNIEVQSANGKLSYVLPDSISANIEGSELFVEEALKTDNSRAMWGLARSLVNNMVTGLSKGFTKNLDVIGVGYKANIKGKYLTISLGYSHDIMIVIPDDLKVSTPKPTQISISGFDKQRVGFFASSIRSLRKPEPYKGKGVRYEGEKIILKEGKKK